MPFDDSLWKYYMKPKSCSSTYRFQKNKTEYSISVNNEDSKQTRKKTWFYLLRQIDSMIKNMHPSQSLIY